MTMTPLNLAPFGADPVPGRPQSNTFTYTVNALNQYTQRTVPGVFDVAGAASSSATVTANGSSSGVTRHGGSIFSRATAW